MEKNTQTHRATQNKLKVYNTTQKKFVDKNV